MSSRQDSRYRMVARYLALGVPLEEVCQAHGLEFLRWRTIVSSQMFRAVLEEINGEIDQRVAEEAVNDPTLATLRLNARKAADTLVEVMEGAAEGVTASSRIKAADSILDRTGFAREKEAAPPQVVFLKISANQLALVMGGNLPKEQPSSVIERV